ncbi:hypothetical protein N9T75_00790 [Bacteroidota bacterium]|nr:hypothetical protein [Bacteroidota bacterium]
MNFLKYLIISIFFMSCGTNNTCGSYGKIIYNLGFVGCDFILEIDGALYEPKNLSDWDNFIYYIDTQEVSIDYQFTNEFSNCSGLEKIDVFCLTNI